MVGALRTALYQLEVTSANIEEIRELAEELNEMIKGVGTHNVGETIAEEIISEYHSDTGSNVNGKFRSVGYETGVVDERLHFTDAQFEYVVGGSDSRNVIISYHREYDIVTDDGEVVDTGPYFIPTKEEAPELYDNFLVWMTKQEFCGFVDV